MWMIKKITVSSKIDKPEAFFSRYHVSDFLQACIVFFFKYLELNAEIEY